MIKLVVSNKAIFLALNKVPLIRRCFVYDFSRLNTINDKTFYNLVFSHIVVGNGLTKTTRSDRFSDLDEILLDLLKPMPEKTVHDIGVSNGITSLELFDKIEHAALPAHFYISDKYAKMYYSGNAVKKFYDADGNLMSVNFFFLHLSPHIGKIFFLSRWLFSFYKKTATINRTNFKEILLLAPAVYRQIQNGKIELLEFDVFETIAIRPFTFLRCLNVLMPAYFSTKQIGEAVNNLGKNLTEDGYLLLGRTDALNVNHATFYTRKDNQLRAVRTVNNGFDYNNPA